MDQAVERALESWPVGNVAAAILTPNRTRFYGDRDRTFPLASLTKLLTAIAAHLAVEEGVLDLDASATDAGATTADLLAHASGLAPDDGERQLAPPRTRRIYSNAGTERVADLVAEHTGFAFRHYLTEGVLTPLGMQSTVLMGSPAHGASSTAADMTGLTRALWHPGFLAAETIERLRTPHLPDLAGVLPGYGRQDPNPWGLGPEIRGHKSPHWTGSTNSPRTYGHFGQAGSMLWIDPVADVALIALADEPFGPWAQEAWPSLSDVVLAST